MLRAESQRIAVMAKAKPAVVAVFAPGGQGGGSGVLISADGYALTNFHVAQPCGNAMKCGLPDGRVYDAVLVGLDPTGDVALIKLLGRDDFPHAELGDSDQLRAGDWVFAMGNPFLLATDFQPTVTYGIVSATHRYQYPAGTLLEYTDCIQTDASINPGNSGGPLFDMEGRLVGINGRCSFEKRGRVSVGVGYAISINQIKNFMGGLRSGRIVDHANLNVRVAADESGRVVVTDILEQSDAYRRGLRLDDELVSFGGRPDHHAQRLQERAGHLPQGLARAAEFSPRRQAVRRDRAAGRAPQQRGPAGEDLGPAAHDAPCRFPSPAKNPRRTSPAANPSDRPEPPKIPGGPKMRRMVVPPPEPVPEIVKQHFGRSRATRITISTSSIRTASGRPGRPRPTSPAGAAPGPSPATWTAAHEVPFRAHRQRRRC